MRKLLIAVLVLVGLCVAADYGAAAAAEYQLAKQVRGELGLATDPSVRINGFPFLTQALLGRYSDIDMRAAGLSVGPLHDVAVEATLHDVDAPLSEVRSGDLRSVRAGEVDGRVRIKDKDLGRAIGIEDLRIEPASDEEIEQLLPTGTVPSTTSGAHRDDSGSGQGSDSHHGSPRGDRDAVRLVATTDLAGERTEIIGIGLLEVTGSLLRITTVDVRLARDDVGEVSLPRQIRQMLIQALSTDVEPGGLPFTVKPTRVWVETGSLIVEGTVRDVSMSQAGTSVG
ncbi:MAG: LmeA family phospholipid-binding protein [Actinobacteria bacterium]|nr:LmeA family phospholipid-binding protein [Actinomycetota bacterium]